MEQKAKVSIAASDIGLLAVIPLAANGKYACAIGIILCVFAWQGWMLYRHIKQISEAAKNPLFSTSSEQILDNMDQLLMQIQDIGDRALISRILHNQAKVISLQRQINPHFLYNTLECIRGQAIRERQMEIAKSIELLARMFRYTVGAGSQLVTLQQEIDHIEDYIALQNYRFRDKFLFLKTFEMEGTAISHLAVPAMLLQPIVENAVQHGLESKIGLGTISLSISISADNLYIRVKDDGIGMDKETLQQLRRSIEHPDSHKYTGGKHLGIALTNVQQRIRLLFGSYYGLRIMSEPDHGTIVECILPKQVMFNQGGD